MSTDGSIAGPSIPDCQPELLGLFEILSDVMFCIKGVDGRYLEVNDAFVRRTGRAAKADVIGRRATELFVAALADRYEQQDERVLSTGRPLRDELELIRRVDGSLGWYLTTKLPLAERQGEGSLVGLVSVSRDLRAPRTTDRATASLVRVVEYVRDHLDSRIRVTQLAEVADCSVPQLERRMRKTFGLTATKFVLRTRVDRAAELLSDSSLTLAEIARAVGFYDQADFTHRFARLTSETPAQFRSNQQAGGGS